MASSEVKNLHVCIIGAGMGGLASALALAKQGFTHVDVFETASALGFVGAGIQLAPNMGRILDRLGCWKEIAAEATNIKWTQVKKGSTDETLAQVDMPDIEQMYGYPHMTGHRSSLAGGIYKGCVEQEKSVKFHWKSSITSVISFTPRPKFTVQPREGEPYDVECDILLGADGIKSPTRVQMLKELGIDAEVKDTGQAAYRIMLTREQMSPYPELLELLDADAVHRWIGERRHIIAYPVSNKTIYNLSSAQPDINFADAPSVQYTTKGSKPAMLKTYETFCPRVQQMLNLVPDGEVCEWKLRVHEPLPTWVHGSVALLGDSCHPTLPHLNQGAAQAIEDAAVLGVVLSKLPSASPDAINRALRVYEKVRKTRAETLVGLAAASGKTLHLGEGAAREERDRQFAAAKEKGESPDKWADKNVQATIYGHDCWKIAEDKFEEYYNELK